MIIGLGLGLNRIKIFADGEVVPVGYLTLKSNGVDAFRLV